MRSGMAPSPVHGACHVLTSKVRRDTALVAISALCPLTHRPHSSTLLDCAMVFSWEEEAAAAGLSDGAKEGGGQIRSVHPWGENDDVRRGSSGQVS